MLTRANKISEAAHRRGGFTLIEMLMTLLLSAVLMAGLWNLFTSYTRLFDTGQRIAAESRLARAVLDQISTDLSGLVDVTQLETSQKAALAGAITESTQSSSSSSSSGISTLPQYRLTGTSNSLRINTFKPGPPRPPREEDEEESGSLSSELEEAEFFAPDLRVVLYDFTEPEEEYSSDDSLPTGLIRRELDWQSALMLNSDEEDEEVALDEDELTSDDQKFLSDSLLNDMEPYEIFAADLNNDQFLWIPEIIEVEFRYSDGKTWSESWDSQFRNALPVLIEISLEFDYEKGLDARYASEVEESAIPTEDEIAADEEALDPEENLETLLNDGEEELPQYRRVIALKTAFQNSSASSSSGESEPGSALSRLQSSDSDDDFDEEASE
ncbi:hypothetical protein Pla110_35410 [Polystyrenella longa]|uniref:Pseudopilin GspJ n=1 Tax=Polystyrenella longa TaxID=2528007 RepID=A0A518CRD5_9PLAN|nr:prepilin-type N-terminal cleavage/methylation domain-containing protein [Polystyrenella longa]QDU81791.1 hypothetical protein Pla110_35410 [Polystyrenella longa]